MFEGTPEEYENLRLRNMELARINKAQEGLATIIKEYLKVARLRYSDVKEAFNLVLNGVFDKEAEQQQ